jgi:outer membrane protein
MKQFNSIATGILALAVAVLFFLHFSGNSNKKNSAAATTGDSTSVSTAGRIGYFEMDSVESQYLYIKEIQAKLKQREQSMSGEMQGLRNSYLGRIQQLQQKAPNMSQQEGESAQAEIDQMQRNMQQKEAKLTQELQEQQFKLMQDINKKIEEVVTEYNQNKGFSYIISRQAGDFIYYKDSTFNITADLVKALNERYNKEKGSKKEEEKKK